MEELFAHPVAKAISVLGLGTLLSIPVAVISELLAKLPPKYLAPDKLPAILAFAGIGVGWLVAKHFGLPEDVAMEIGGIAGGFSGAKTLRRNGRV